MGASHPEPRETDRSEPIPMRRMAFSSMARTEIRALRAASRSASVTRSLGRIRFPGVSCSRRAKQFASPTTLPRPAPLRKSAPPP